MTVGDLMPCLSGIVAPAGSLGAGVRDRVVTAIAYDSRQATAGAIFVAVSGQRFDGAAFAADAIGRGAVLVVSASAPPVDGRIAWVMVKDARLALAELAAAFHRDPSHDLTVVGVTGTNGKTTTTYMLAAIFDAAGWPCGRIGSVGYDTGGNDAGRGAHDPGGAGGAGVAARDGPAPARGVCDGGLLARACDAACRGDPVRRRGLLEPHP